MGILNKYREMDRIALPLKFFSQNLWDHLPRLLTRCRNVREIIPFLVRSRANIIQTLKKNLAMGMLAQCTSIDFTVTARPGAYGFQAFHWSAQEGVILRQSFASTHNCQTFESKCRESG